MTTLFNLFIILGVIINHIEISSGIPPKEIDFLKNFGKDNETSTHEEASLESDCLADCGPIDRVPRGIPSFPRRHQSSEMYLPPVEPLARARSRSPIAGRTISPYDITSSERLQSPGSYLPLVDPHLREGSRSPGARCNVPPTKILLSDGTEFALDKLEFIRLTPQLNPHRLFELQRYTFPPDESIKLRMGNRYVRVPMQEQIVLSTSDGEVFAILENSNVLAGLYSGRPKRRARINIRSGIITMLTQGETFEIPVGELRLITMNFRVERVTQNPEHSAINSNNI